MSRTKYAHRVNWRGIDGAKGRVCGECGETAANVPAQQLHADLHEARPFDTRGLIAPLDAPHDAPPMGEGERLLRDIFTNHLEES